MNWESDIIKVSNATRDAVAVAKRLENIIQCCPICRSKIGALPGHQHRTEINPPDSNEKVIPNGNKPNSQK